MRHSLSEQIRIREILCRLHSARSFRNGNIMTRIRGLNNLVDHCRNKSNNTSDDRVKLPKAWSWSFVPFPGKSQRTKSPRHGLSQQIRIQRPSGREQQRSADTCVGTLFGPEGRGGADHERGLGWTGAGRAGPGRAGLGWAGLGWAGLGWAGLPSPVDASQRIPQPLPTLRFPVPAPVPPAVAG